MKKQYHSCNVFNLQPQGWRLWTYHLSGNHAELAADLTGAPETSAPIRVVQKDWANLWRKKLNIAWIPPEHVFLRVVQLPATDRTELLSMLEFQLEKLSPIPVGQIVWGVEVLPSPLPESQTAVVVIVSRDEVEKHLNKLEAAKYYADRLEFPFLQPILAASSREDGAVIYPEPGGIKELCLAAWWQNGVLQNLQLLHFPAEKRIETLKEQLSQLAWAGELEGWLRLPVHWRLVVDDASAEYWRAAFNEWPEMPIEVSAPMPAPELAKVSALKNAREEVGANLLPVDFSTRYRQIFVDRLWMRGLAAVLGVYLVGVIIYFGFLQVLKFRNFRLDQQRVALSGSYTNALQLRERIQILEDQVNLKYAALDSFRVASEMLPPELTLNWFVFGRVGNSQGLTLHGTAPQNKNDKVTDYNEALRNAVVNGQPLFSKVNPPRSISHGGAAAQTINWSFQCELSRVDLD